MLEQLRNRVPVSRVFLQADEDEVLGVVGDLGGLGELDLVLDLDRLAVTIFMKSCSVVISKGTRPKSSS